MIKFIVKLFPEINMKSDRVRARFVDILSSNIRNILRKQDQTVSVLNHWDHLEVRSKQDHLKNKLIEELQHIPGIHHILSIDEYHFNQTQEIVDHVLHTFSTQIAHKTFCVRIKRKGKHDFSSLELQKQLGAILLQTTPTAKVNLQHPDIEIKLEIHHQYLWIVTQRYSGLGGFPIGTQENVLSLISGGYDSGVSSYMFVRRGCRTHYCFFNLGGDQHELGVKQMAYHIWNRYGSSHKTKLIIIDFAAVVTEILTKIHPSLMGVVLKRMMIRAASAVAQKLKISAIITGEAVGQVSSQTLHNLAVIDAIANVMVLRPLITHDKEDIIQIAKNIGTEDIAKTIPEYCGVISNRPNVKAVKEKVEQAEKNFDFSILDDALQNLNRMDIRDIGNHTDEKLAIMETSSTIQQNDIIVDIRRPDETEQNPLQIENIKIIRIPFYALKKEFPLLDPSKNYLLYCRHGTMSKLQALYLQEAGYKNIQVLDIKM